MALSTDDFNLEVGPAVALAADSQRLSNTSAVLWFWFPPKLPLPPLGCAPPGPAAAEAPSSP
jgi:hypothetical protein